MKYVKDFIKRKRLISGLVLVALFIIILYQVTSDMPDIFPPWGEFTFSFGVKLSYSYMASFIFYVLVTYVPSFRDKKKVYKYIEHKVRELVSLHDALIKRILQAEEKYHNDIWAKLGVTRRQYDIDNLSFEDCKQLLQSVRPEGLSPIFLGFASVLKQQPAKWCDLVVDTIDRSNDSILKVLRTVVYMEPELLEILTSLETTVLFKERQLIADMAMTNQQDFVVINKGLHDYHLSINNLKSYITKCVYFESNVVLDTDI